MSKPELPSPIGQDEVVHLQKKVQKSWDSEIDFTLEAVKGSDFSKAFADEVVKALESMPRPLTDIVNTNGYAITVCRLAQDAFLGVDKNRIPLATDKKPLTYANVQSFFVLEYKVIVLPEFYEDLNTEDLNTKELVRNEGLPDILKHEFGHVLDEILIDPESSRQLSHTRRFRRAYVADCRALSDPSEVHQALLSSMRDGKYTIGRLEACASVFAAMLGGGEEADFLLASFKRVSKVIEKKVTTRLRQEGWSREDCARVFSYYNDRKNQI